MTPDPLPVSRPSAAGAAERRSVSETQRAQMIVFVTGGTGYMGRALIPKLLEQGRQVRALARPGSERKLPPGCEVILGDALRSASFSGHVRGADALVHLVGAPQPAPWKAAQFRAVDLPSVRAAVEAAKAAAVRHFIYVSVAQPAPVMKAYIAVRAECEALIRASGLSATFLRPWYVLGPGHRWPLLLQPVYRILELLPPAREPARRFGLITIEQMTSALAWAVDHPPQGVQIVGVSEMRAASRPA
jgi:uncharacterized protein YbjT (DUF2867 family)